MYLVDSHCHLYMLGEAADGGDLNQYIENAKRNSVHYFLNVCVSLRDFPKVIAPTEQFDFIKASVGVHPNEQDELYSPEKLLELAAHQNVIAIGETGLDYFRSTGDLTWQQDRFRAHIAVAKSVRKPLIIHTREAKADTLRIMREEQADAIGGVMHCFTEDWETAKLALDLGFYISFSGIVTFKNATVIQDVARQIPLDRMLVETDAPYLAPNPMRGKLNEPGYVRYTAEYLAALRGISLETLAAQTTENFFTLFNGAVKPHV